VHSLEYTGVPDVFTPYHGCWRQQGNNGIRGYCCNVIRLQQWAKNEPGSHCRNNDLAS
jgi:hypothetical protein